MATVIDTAVAWALAVAADDSHGYSQTDRWGPNYDCSSFVITAYEKAGVGVKSAGASYTGNMYEAFTKCGFTDVSNEIDFDSGAGLIKGDILLNTVKHTALCRSDGGGLVHAANASSGICTAGYYSGGWNYVLRLEDGAHYTSSSGAEYMYSANASSEASVVWNERKSENIQKNLQNLPALSGGEGTLSVYAGANDISEYLGDFNLSGSIYTLAASFTFSVAKTDDEHIELYEPQVGDVVRIVTNAEIFRGVIVKSDVGDTDKNQYTAYDLGWYLNKTSQTYQFTDISAQAAIREICDDLQIEIDTLPSLSTVINQIYFDKTVSDIIADILDECGGGYNYDFTPSGLRIYEIGTFYAYPEFRLASNLPFNYAGNYLADVSRTYSIEDMKNSIKITSEDSNVYAEVMTLQNTDLIEKYGFLQEVVKIDTDKENAETVAKEHLAEGAVVSEEYSFTILERLDSYTRAGETITINDKLYVIQSVNHTVSGGIHKNQISVKAAE